MRYLPSLPDDPQLWDALACFPKKGAGPLILYSDIVLRGPSPLSIGEREMIAVMTSRLNGSEFCANTHSVYACAFGISNEVLEAVPESVESNCIEERMKPILRYAIKLTEDPASINETDTQAILDAGWPEEAIYDTASVVGLFSLTNRLVRGLGIPGHQEEYLLQQKKMEQIPLKERVASNTTRLGENFYSDMCKKFGLS